MSYQSNIVSSLHHLRMACDFMEDFEREHAGSKGAILFSGYRKKIEWIKNDLITNPNLPRQVIDGIKAEWKSDVWSVPAITDKLALLNESQRELIEDTIDNILKGNIELVK